MSNPHYKYQIWNSVWYKKTISETRHDWEEAVVNGSNELKTEAKEKKNSINSFFPWWRQER